MTSMSDQEFAQTEVLLRQRLAQLAQHAPTAVHIPGEVPVVATNRPTGRGRRAGVIAAVTALIGAGGFTTYSFLGASNDGGAATPEEAVTMFVSALENEDVIGMIDLALPEEVAVLRAAIDSATSDAKRVGLLADEFNVSGVQGIDISIDDLVLDTNFLEGGLAIVTATGGTIGATFDQRAVALGERLRALIGEGETASAVTTIGESDSPWLLMTVQRDGRWYVAAQYTVAEYIRQAAGWEIPGQVARTPVGFDSPEAAATGFYDGLASLDLQAALDTFAPGEDAMAWLAQAWMSDGQAAIDRGRADGWSVAVSGLTYETIGSGDHLMLRPATFTVQGTTPAGFNRDSSGGGADPSLSTVVTSSDGYAVVPPGQVPATIDGLTFSTDFPTSDVNYNFTNVYPDGTIAPLVFPADPTEGPRSFTIERADDCTTVTGSLAESTFGSDPGSGASAVDGGYQVCGAGSQLFGGLVMLFSGTGLELPAVSVVQSAGKWYVSPLGTALGGLTLSLHDITDGSSLFDSALAPYFYGGLSRPFLESMLNGQSVDGIDAACLSALTVEDGLVTGVVADPSTDAIRACANTGSYEAFGGAVTVEGTSPATPVPAPAPETLVPASTTP